MKAIKDEKGLTLIEVLAALVILSIAFIGIMTIFPQMTVFNAKTEAKLDTMNLVRQEMERIVSNSPPSVWIGERDPADSTIYDSFEMKLPDVMETNLGFARDLANTSPAFERYHRDVVNSDFNFEADIYLACEALISEASGGLPCNDPSLTQLYKVHLKVFDESHLSSETYSFIKFKVEE